MVKNKVVLSLGGGGSKGPAHIGVIKYLEENCIPIDALAGTSIGALVASLYAFGKTSDDIIKVFEKLNPFEYKGLNFEKGVLGIWKNTSLIDTLHDEFPNNPNIEDSNIKLYILATRLKDGKSVFFEKGNLIQAILASCAIPGVYNPQKINGDLYADGGLSEVVPYSCFSKKDIKICSSFVCKVHKNPKNTLELISNSLDIALDNKTKEQMKYVDFVIEIDASHYSKIKIEKINELVQLGYDSSKKLESFFLIKFIFHKNRIINLFQQFNFIHIPKIFKFKKK